MGLKQAAPNALHGRQSNGTRRRLDIAFEKDRLLSSVFGYHDENLVAIENRTGVSITARGNRVVIEGDPDCCAMVEDVLRDLYRRVDRGEEIDPGLIDGVLAMSGRTTAEDVPGVPSVVRLDNVSIRTRRKTIMPRSEAQARYMQALATQDMIFALGPAGTGKTYVAVAQAVSELVSGRVQRLVLSRPAVEAGERLGFLPGDMKEKVDPYLRPIYDALHDCMPSEQVERRIAAGEIEIAPLAFMRGRTLADAFILLDEAQNTTPAQMKMFLTRFGQNSRMVICGDPKQTDLPGGPEASGLADAVRRLDGTEGMAFCRFGTSDVVRHPIVGRVVEAYEGRND
jgi:phosphate starvation-inducible PhoH-like protein